MFSVKTPSTWISAAQMPNSTELTFEFQCKTLLRSGFLYLKSFIPRDQVSIARQEILQADLSTSLLDQQHITRIPSVLNVLEHENIKEWCEKYFKFCGCSSSIALPIPFKWLRAVTNGKFTGPHFDRYYIGYGSQHILTVWIPLGDISPQMGGMIVSPGSHSDPTFYELRQRFGVNRSVDDDGTTSGWIVQDAAEIKADWQTSQFEMGDVVILLMDVLHMTCPNDTLETRISCDTRWQPLEDSYPPWQVKSEVHSR